MSSPPPASIAGVTVRLARPADYAFAGALAFEAYAIDGLLDDDSDYAADLRDAGRRAEDAELFVAIDERGDVVGTVTFCLPGSPYSELSKDGQAEFRMLAVDPAAGGHGAGTALVAAVVQRASELGADRVVMCSVEPMRTAQRIYLRMGFARLPDRDWSPDGAMVLLAYGMDLS